MTVRNGTTRRNPLLESALRGCLFTGLLLSLPQWTHAQSTPEQSSTSEQPSPPAPNARTEMDPSIPAPTSTPVADSPNTGAASGASTGQTSPAAPTPAPPEGAAGDPSRNDAAVGETPSEPADTDGPSETTGAGPGASPAEEANQPTVPHELAADETVGELVPTPPPTRFFITYELGSSLLTALAEVSLRSFSLEHQLRFGRMWERWAVYGFVEHVAWDGPSGNSRIQALNVGIGIESLHRSGFLRTSLLIGPSILLQGTHLDSPGQVGLFIDMRPLGFRWKLNRRWSMVVDPIHFSIVMPVLSGIPLVDVQFRTTVGAETHF